MPAGSKNGVFEFDRFQLDADKLMLYRDGEELPVRPKVVQTLLVLVHRRGEILSKGELIDAVWSDTVVEESNLSQHLYQLRKILGNLPSGQPYIETLRRRGYRFNGEVRIVASPTEQNRTLNVKTASNGEANISVERQGNVLRLVERARDAKPEPILDKEHPSADVKRFDTANRRWKMIAVAALFVCVAAFGLIAVAWYQRLASANAAVNFSEISISRLTNGAWPLSAAISRDGKYFAYTEAEGDRSHIWLQAVGQPRRISIAEASDKLFGYKAFSPDGRFIYYSANDKQSSGKWDLYRIPTMGGPSIKILDKVQAISFSPNGAEFVFYRLDEASGVSSMVIADSDGRKERTVVTRTKPVYLAGTPTWSPDGTTVIFAEFGPNQNNTTNHDRFYAVDVATRKIKDASPENWDTIYKTEWTRDGSGFVLIGTRENDSYTTRRDQVYFVSYPDGVSRRITTDGIRHEPSSLGVTDDGSILALASNRSAQIWSMNANGDIATAEQISKGLYDGRPGLAAMPDGRLGFITYTSDDPAIWVMNSNGSDMIQLTGGPLVVEELRSDPLGRYFVFSVMKDRQSHLYRIDADGNNLKQLTSTNGSEIDSAVSPDGKWVAYGSASPEAGNANRLFRSTIDGEAASPIGENNCSRPNFSPDGKYLSCITDDDKQILIITASDGSRVKTLDIPSNSIVNFGVKWTPDNSAVVFIGGDSGGSNLWALPINGEPVRRLTNFTSGTIFRFTYSTDGSRIYLARGFPIQDVILIKNFR